MVWILETGVLSVSVENTEILNKYSKNGQNPEILKVILDKIWICKGHNYMFNKILWYLGKNLKSDWNTEKPWQKRNARRKYHKSHKPWSPRSDEAGGSIFIGRSRL